MYMGWIKLYLLLRDTFSSISNWNSIKVAGIIDGVRLLCNTVHIECCCLLSVHCTSITLSERNSWMDTLLLIEYI